MDEIRALLTAAAAANKATAEAGQANAAHISEIHASLEKLMLSQQEGSRTAARMETTMDKVITANAALDHSVADLRQSMNRVVTRLSSVETIAAQLVSDEQPNGRRSAHRTQGAGTGEDRTSSRALVRELQESDMEDLKTFVDVLAAENTEFQIKVKEVDAGAEHSQNPANHKHITEDLNAELRKLQRAYEALCSEKGRKVSEITAERDFFQYQVKTLERENADLLGNMKKEATRATEARKELQQNVEQLQVLSQKKDNEILKLQAQAIAKGAEAKKKLVPKGKVQKMDSMCKKKDGEMEKCKDLQPVESQKNKEDLSEKPNEGCSEGPALMAEIRNCSPKQMLGEDGRPEPCQKRKCATFLSNNDGQNGNDEETRMQVLEPLKKKTVSGKKGVEQEDNMAKLAKGKSHSESNRSPHKLQLKDSGHRGRGRPAKRGRIGQARIYKTSRKNDPEFQETRAKEAAASRMLVKEEALLKKRAKKALKKRAT